MWNEIWTVTHDFLRESGFGQFYWGNAVMIGVGILFVYLAVKKGFEPLLLVPIGFGIIMGNVPYNTATTPVGALDGPVDESKLQYVATVPFTFDDVAYDTWQNIPNPIVGKKAVADGQALMINRSGLMAYAGSFGQVRVQEQFQGRQILLGHLEKTADGREFYVAKPRPDGQYPLIVHPEQQNPWRSSPLWLISRGVDWDFFPPLIFLGLGALTDFGPLLANPRTIILGAAAQFGIFGTIFGARALGFSGPEAGSIGIIGGADGPTAIYTCTKLAPDLLGAVALSAYSYMAMVPLIQPPIMRLLTTKKERMIRMEQPKNVTRAMRVMFPVIGFLLCGFIANAALPLLGCLFFGNLLRESGVVERLSKTAQTTFIDIVTILLGLSVGAKTQASTFLTMNTVGIFLLGMVSFALATAAGLLMAKLMNLISKKKVNPLIGSAGVSAVPMAARVSQMMAHRDDPHNFILMHAMGPNVAGVIGTAVAAGVLLSYYGSH